MFHSCRFRQDRGAFVAVSGFSSSLRVLRHGWDSPRCLRDMSRPSTPSRTPGERNCLSVQTEIGGNRVRFLRSHLLLWKDPDFGRAWCWWLACHLLTRREATHPVKWLLGHKLFTALSYERHFILFSKRTPTAKIPSFFIYFLYLFVISVVSDCLSICPTHEPCVYIKSWCCCERQRVSIASQTSSQRCFSGKATVRKVPAGSGAPALCYYIVLVLCCLFGLSFGNTPGHPTKCEGKEPNMKSR